MEQYIVVLVTIGSQEDAELLAKKIVDNRLAACVNISTGLRSIYLWDGAIQDQVEVLMIIKTTSSRFDELKDFIIHEHPYDVPEVISIDISEGHTDYLEWIKSSVK